MTASSTVAAPEQVLRSVADRVLWIATAIVDAANRGRPNDSGVKVGGHQASSASMVDIMVALWFGDLQRDDRVSVKPHASPVLHAINYLLGDLDGRYLTASREMGGLQAYPSGPRIRTMSTSRPAPSGSAPPLLSGLPWRTATRRPTSPRHLRRVASSRSSAMPNSTRAPCGRR
jgi:pyruvate dehydrogenase complex dehydrogenase (E1) component